MKSGNMFGRLRKYKESAYFNSHRIITFDTLYEDWQYAVFSVMEMDTTPGTARWYDLWSLVTDRIPDREEAIRNLERRSVVRDVLDVRADDQILLLVTCLDDDDRERLVVAARRLRTGETQDRLTIRASSSHLNCQQKNYPKGFDEALTHAVRVRINVRFLAESPLSLFISSAVF
jgi:hypothetical protein